MKVVSAEEMSHIENQAFANGASESAFMEQAGLGITNKLLTIVGNRKITLLASKGNNSGDAYVVGRYLLQKGIHPLTVEVPTDKRSSLCEANRKRYLELGGQTLSYKPGCLSKLRNSCFLDALFGTGFQGELKSPYKELCEEINSLQAFLVSIDIPSGLNGSNGQASKHALKASHTIYLGLPKLGFFIEDGPEHIGKLHRVDFGLPEIYKESAKSSLQLFTPSSIKVKRDALKRTRHKYESGALLTIAGSKKMPGAALLSCMSAFASGAGIVYLHTESKSALPQKPWELIISEGPIDQAPEENFKKAKALLIGPGLDETEENYNVIQELLQSTSQPCVIDASALNLISKLKNPSFPKDTLLTPHLQEMHRLLGLKERMVVNQDFLNKCREYAKKHAITILLKGAVSFIFHHDEIPMAMYEGTPGLSKAGTGDVLAGIIASLLARGHSSYVSAIIGNFLHSRAGIEACADLSHLSLTASSLIHKLPYVIKKLLSPIETDSEDFELCLS